MCLRCRTQHLCFSFVGPGGWVNWPAGDRRYLEVCKEVAPHDRDDDHRSSQLKGSSELVRVIAMQGQTLGYFPRDYVERHNLLHRAVGLLVTNAERHVFVHRRSPAKSVHASMLDMFVGGLVVGGEDPEAAARCVAEPPPLANPPADSALATTWEPANCYDAWRGRQLIGGGRFPSGPDRTPLVAAVTFHSGDHARDPRFASSPRLHPPKVL